MKRARTEPGETPDEEGVNWSALTPTDLGQRLYNLRETNACIEQIDDYFSKLTSYVPSVKQPGLDRTRADVADQLRRCESEVARRDAVLSLWETAVRVSKDYPDTLCERTVIAAWVATLRREAPDAVFDEVSDCVLCDGRQLSPTLQTLIKDDMWKSKTCSAIRDTVRCERCKKKKKK